MPSQRDEVRLPIGTTLRPFTVHGDERGTLTEIFRQEWLPELRALQWNFVRSRAGVLRGVHVHPKHVDYLLVLDGAATIGLQDLRPGSPTEGLACIVELEADRPASIVIPAGVAHGFYFDVPSLHVYAVSEYWDPADELGCRYDDPGLRIAWPAVPKLMSARDEGLPTLESLRGRIPAYRGPC